MEEAARAARFQRPSHVEEAATAPERRIERQYSIPQASPFARGISSAGRRARAPRCAGSGENDPPIPQCIIKLREHDVGVVLEDAARDRGLASQALRIDAGSAAALPTGADALSGFIPSNAIARTSVRRHSSSYGSGKSIDSYSRHAARR